MMMRCLGWLALLMSAPLEAGDWPQFLGPRRDGSADDETIVDRLSGPPKILWRRSAGQGFSGPAVVGDTLILFHQPGDEEVVEAVSIKTGKTLWKTGYPCAYQGGYGTGPGPRATPAVAKNIVVTFGAQGFLQASDLADGKVRWKRDLTREHRVPEGFFGVGTSPLLDGDQVLVTVGAETASLVAFDIQTGQTRWNASNDQASYASPTLATIAGNRRALFFARSGLHIVDPADGKEIAFHRYRARMNASVNAATPLVHDNQIFLSAEYGTGAVLLELVDERLEPVWQSQESLSNHYDTSVLVDGYLFGIDGRQEFGARLRCVEWSTGKVRWTEEAFGCASLIRVGRKILAVTESGEVALFAANPDRFEPLGRFQVTGAPTRAHPAVSAGVLFIRSPDELLAVDLSGR